MKVVMPYFLHGLKLGKSPRIGDLGVENRYCESKDTNENLLLTKVEDYLLW